LEEKQACQLAMVNMAHMNGDNGTYSDLQSQGMTKIIVHALKIQ
jgi:hypothetical protein